MMRGDDPQHMDEIRWMITHENISRHQLEEAFITAHVPDDLEIAEAFATAKPLVLGMSRPT
jgi:hypothetical protein